MQFSDDFFQFLANTNRYLTMLRRRYSRTRHLFSPRFINKINNCRYHLSKLRTIYIPVLHQSSNVNIFHCCVQKTGSQWITSMLSDIMTYRYSGLIRGSRRILGRNLTEPFPMNTIVSPLYIDYQTYMKIPKLGQHKTFFVMRDPRDIVVSWYFSTKHTHVIMGEDMLHRRKELNNLPINDGIIYAIEFLSKIGRFSTMRSWIEAEENDPNVILIRYEDLISQGNVGLKKLFYDLDIQIPEKVLGDLIQAYSFKRLSGRDKGKENQYSHLRKGVSGDWRNYFDSRIENRFYELCGDLHEYLGYT